MWIRARRAAGRPGSRARSPARLTGTGPPGETIGGANDAADQETLPSGRARRRARDDDAIARTKRGDEFVTVDRVAFDCPAPRRRLIAPHPELDTCQTGPDGQAGGRHFTLDLRRGLIVEPDARPFLRC
jgi:hypothetical protein